MDKLSKVFVAGHRGLVGSALCRYLRKNGYRNLVLRSHAELDLRNRIQVSQFFESERPEYVFLAAAKVGGILANSRYPADFLRDNIDIQTNVIDLAYQNGVRKLQFLGSSCIYPKFSAQPIKEEYLLTGALEPTNEWYAIAKIAGIKMVQAYRRQYGFAGISVMPTNLYGPGDNFDLENSHVLPALIRKFHEAKVSGAGEVVVWGTGKPRREFLHVDDMAEACVFLMEHYDSDEIVNVGVGKDISIRELAELVQGIVGYEGELVFDTSRPDGTPQKMLDVSKINALGWEAKIGFRAGLASTYEWYVEHQAKEPSRIVAPSI